MLSALQKLVTVLRDDLRDCLDGKTDEPTERKAALADARDRVRKEYDATKAAERTVQAFPAWREDYLTQVAVAWVLACVFVRYLEDNAFVADCWLGGPDDQKREEGRARHAGFFRANKTATDRDYLLAVFRRTADIPAAHDLFAEGKTPLWTVGPSADVATTLVNFWHARDDEGAVPSFERADGDTRFLGDLYQDLSEDARKKYALLQTPVFVEEFILDRTLDPACKEFGFQHVRLIDPTCGSGHFLLGAFDRLMRLWKEHYAELVRKDWNAQDAAGRVLGDGEKYPGQVFGTDINPFAVAIARFRLLIAACKWCGVARLKDAPGWSPQVFSGDSLYHGMRWIVGTNKQSGKGGTAIDPDWDNPYHLEDVKSVTRVLSQKYHAVVGNPPYITVKDAAQNARYRERYGTCHQKYSLGVPFTERFWDLCLAPDNTAPAGFVGLITANSFMKREFGTKLIEDFFPKIDLTHVIDTSGAYLPGHGTPTVILFGQNKGPREDVVRAVLGIKGEPTSPDDAAQGLVWTSIIGNVDQPGAQTEFVSITDVLRTTFAHHPWSIGGGGAAELKEQLDDGAKQTLNDITQSIGFMAITGEDDFYVTSNRIAKLYHAPARQFCTGDTVRDWTIATDDVVLFPYRTSETQLVPDEPDPLSRFGQLIWAFRAWLSARSMFGKSALEHGQGRYGFMQFIHERVTAQRLISFGEVSTHNHFVLDRGGKVFKQTAPVIKLPTDAKLDQHLELLGLLNSSTAGFWLKQVCFAKGGDTVGAEGARVRKTLWDVFYAFSSTPVGGFPLPACKPLALPKRLDALAQEYAANLPSAVCKRAVPTRAALDAARQKAEAIRRQMIFLQEELDWECYHLYGLTAEAFTYSGEPLALALGERAFEVVMARSGEKTAWFDRHRSTPITELPAHWPADYRKLVSRRLAEIESNPNVKLIERPEYKRRWSSDTWESMESSALRLWLLDRLEGYFAPEAVPLAESAKDAKEDKGELSSKHSSLPLRLSRALREISLYSCDQIGSDAAQDEGVMTVAAVYTGNAMFDVVSLVTELVTAEAVPYLPVQRYKKDGFRKRLQWEETWALQRREDAGEKLKEPIPVPPKYTSADFQKSDYWRLRGKLDVPKERWVSYPGAERDGDPTPVVTWAGYDHLGQARALAAYYQEAKDKYGWTNEKLIPLLAGLDQLVPWLKQWHNEHSEEFGGKPGDEIETFVSSAAADLRVSLESIRDWKPPERKLKKNVSRKERVERKE